MQEICMATRQAERNRSSDNNLEQIFERSNFKNEVGAALSLHNNSQIALESWGIDLVKDAGGLPMHTVGLLLLYSCFRSEF